MRLLNLSHAFRCVLFITVIFSSLSSFSQLRSLTGTITDFDTKKPLEGVSIVVKGHKKGTVSGENGSFVLNLPIDKYELVFSLSGYHSFARTVYLLDENNISIELKKKPPTELPEVIVETRRKDANVSEAQMSTINVNIPQLRKTPLVLGEADIIKALTLRTGVTTAGEGAGGFNVRGGNSDQNLVLLDGAPVFNTSHLLGFYSTISPDAIQDATLYKGAIPASYGGRLSSLLSLSVKSGNDQDLRYTTTISPVSAKFFADGPVNKKLTFIAGGRIAYPKLVMNLFRGDVKRSNAFFYDGIAKMLWKIDEKNRLSFSLYRSQDNFSFPGDTAYGWQFSLASLNWHSQLTPKLLLNANANDSYYSSDIIGSSSKYEFRLRSTIEQQEAKLGMLYSLSDQTRIEGGIDLIRYMVSPGEIKPTAEGSNINAVNLESETGNEMAGYLTGSYDLTSLITLEAGIRYSAFTYRGAGTIFKYEDGKPRSPETITDSSYYSKGKPIQKYAGPEPRILLKIGINDQTSVKLSYNRTRQYLQLISNTIAITPIDYWKLSDPINKPEIANQFAAGLFRNFNSDLYETSAEVFYKKSDNLIEYRNGATISMNRYIDADLLRAQGKAYGVEINFRKTKGKISGQVGYTYSRSLQQVITSFPIEQVNGGEFYSSNFDRPHNLNILGSYQLGNGWTFSYNFVFTSGRPATFPDGNYTIDSTIVTNYSRRNADRLPDYHRLDISFSFDSRRFPEQKRYSILNFSVYNVYARKNPYSVFFRREGNVQEAYRLSVLATLIPSITWNYYF